VAVFKQLAGVTDRFLDSLSMDYLGYIPHDEQLPQAVRRQRLVTELYPNATSSLSFARLSERILEEEEKFSLDGNIKFFWRELVNF